MTEDDGIDHFGSWLLQVIDNADLSHLGPEPIGYIDGEKIEDLNARWAKAYGNDGG